VLFLDELTEFSPDLAADSSARVTYAYRGAVVVLAGTIAADPVECRMPSGDEVIEPPEASSL
jgi:hypothetical protein